MNDGTSIRRMQLEDLDRVVAIDQASFTLPWPARSFRYEITDNPTARSWVAERNGEVIGLLVLWLIAGEAHIATLATHPDFRRQGVASRLLLHTLRAAAAEGAHSAVLEVRAGNLPAQAMYAKYGFVQDGRRARYYKDNGEDAILMSLPKLAMETFGNADGG